MPEQLLDYKTASSMRKEFSSYAAENMNLSSNAQLVFREVYLRSLEDGRDETVADRMAAMSVDLASAEMKYFPENMPRGEKVERVRSMAKRTLDLYLNNELRVNTPTNLNMGRWEAVYDQEGKVIDYAQTSQMGSACFVIPVGDTFGEDVNTLEDGILESWVTQQLVHKGGGGTGFSFQRLRPKGSIIKYNPVTDGMISISWDGRRGVSSGYESFLNSFYNESTEAVKQGNSRRGANMGIQRVDHMDFLDHMYAKFGKKGDRSRSEWRMKNFNLSLAVTDEFMEAAVKGYTYTLMNPHRADPRIKRVLQKRQGIENPEVVRRDDISTKKQFESILEKNSKNPFAPLTTPNMYIDDDGKTVVNAYTGDSIGFIVNDEVRIDAGKVLDIFAELTHSNGEPGMIFIDRINEFNPLLLDREIESTNPCGEQPLPPYGACTLASINVGRYAKYEIFERGSITLEKRILDDKFTKTEERSDGKIGIMWYDWDSLRETIRDGTRILDNVIDRSDFPASKIDKAVEEMRNIGLGYMGVWDAMVLMKTRYGSENSYEFAEELAKVLDDESLIASQKLAEERGEFPLWEKSTHNPDSEAYRWVTSNPKTIPDRFLGSRNLSDQVNREKVMKYGAGKVRNVCRMTQAPTGTIRRTTGYSLEELALDNLSISSGVEPSFSLVELSNIINTQVEDFSGAAAKLLHREGLPVIEIADAIRKNKGSAWIYDYTDPEVAKVLEKIPEDVREVLVTAAGGEGEHYEIDTETHIRMASRFQRYNDSAISKTMNLPSSATHGEVREAWVNLWRSGAKGGTFYVDESRDFQILNVVQGDSEKIKKRGKRPFMQESITFEFPYLPSSRDSNEHREDTDFDPDRVFTTITYNPVNGGITGIFQNIPEVDPERLSMLTELVIDKSRSLREGRSLGKIIADLEKISIVGAQKGVVIDEAVMPEGSKETMKYQLSGATTSEARLYSFYVMRFLTDDGKNFDRNFMQERLGIYYSGEMTLRTIINTQGKITIEAKEDGRPSILGSKKVITLPKELRGMECPECG